MVRAWITLGMATIAKNKNINAHGMAITNLRL